MLSVAGQAHKSIEEIACSRAQSSNAAAVIVSAVEGESVDQMDCIGGECNLPLQIFPTMIPYDQAVILMVCLNCPARTSQAHKLFLASSLRPVICLSSACVEEGSLDAKECLMFGSHTQKHTACVLVGNWLRSDTWNVQVILGRLMHVLQDLALAHPGFSIAFGEESGPGYFAAVDGQGRLQQTGWIKFPTLQYVSWAAQWLEYQQNLETKLEWEALVVPIFESQVPMQSPLHSLQ